MISTLKRPSHYLFLILLIPLMFCNATSSNAVRKLDDIPIKEFQELGYKNYNVLLKRFTACVQLHIKDKNITYFDCNRHSDAMLFLILEKPRIIASSLSQYLTKDYLDSYNQACSNALPWLDASKEEKIEICECAANESLNLLSSQTLKELLNGNMSKEQLGDVLIRSDYAKRICKHRIMGGEY